MRETTQHDMTRPAPWTGARRRLKIMRTTVTLHLCQACLIEPHRATVRPWLQNRSLVNRRRGGGQGKRACREFRTVASRQQTCANSEPTTSYPIIVHDPNERTKHVEVVS